MLGEGSGVRRKAYAASKRTTTKIWVITVTSQEAMIKNTNTLASLLSLVYNKLIIFVSALVNYDGDNFYKD